MLNSEILNWLKLLTEIACFAEIGEIVEIPSYTLPYLAMPRLVRLRGLFSCRIWSPPHPQVSPPC